MKQHAYRGLVVNVPYSLDEVVNFVNCLSLEERKILAKGPIAEYEGKCRVCLALGYPEDFNIETPEANLALSAYHNCVDIDGSLGSILKVMQARCFVIYLEAKLSIC